MYCLKEERLIEIKHDIPTQQFRISASLYMRDHLENNEITELNTVSLQIIAVSLARSLIAALQAPSCSIVCRKCFDCIAGKHNSANYSSKF